MQRMKHPGPRLALVLMLALALVGGVIAAVPDAVDIAWFTIEGGGGSASGGGYTLDDTIGQADAASASGGEYMLDGGFWTSQAADISYRLFAPLVSR